MAGMRSGFLIGLAVGVGAAVLGPYAWRTGRPAAKAAMRAGIEGYVVARGAAARFAEDVEDLAAEVRHEMQAEAETAEAAADDSEEDAIRVVGGMQGAPSNG